MFDAQLRADIETIDVTINNYERLANAPQAWERIKKSLEGVRERAPNSRVTSVLVDAMNEHCLRSMPRFKDYQRWCEMYQNLHGKATS